MISAPEQYGYTAEQTLSHECKSQPPDDFEEYWRRWREEVMSAPQRWHGEIDSSVNQVVVRSIHAVRVAAQVTMPSNVPRAIVITTHGYGDVPDRLPEVDEAMQPWSAHDLITIRVRVRGFPPSTMDIGDVRGDWILRGIETQDAWLLRGAVADLVLTCRCAQNHFGEALPLFLHGESFGGGLAVMAAAQLSLFNLPPQRLVLALPSLGDWQWRSTHYCNGSGALINMLLDALRGEQRDNLMHTLLLFDAAIHARNVQTPCLCKLALADDVVPAPSAAAVFNGLGSSAKWRFQTRFGHFDGGIADARRHLRFERLQLRFCDPAFSLADFGLEFIESEPDVIS